MTTDPRHIYYELRDEHVSAGHTIPQNVRDLAAQGEWAEAVIWLQQSQRSDFRDADHLTAEALFASDLQPSQHPDPAALAETVERVIARYGCAGCAERVAAEFGDHPDTSAARMRWALAAESQLVAGGAA